MFIFPWERVIMAKAQIPKECHSQQFLLSEIDIKETEGTRFSTLN